MRAPRFSFSAVAPIVLSTLLWGSAVSVAAGAQEISIKFPAPRESHEGSSLLKVENAPLLRANAWKLAFWVVFDEGGVESALGLLGLKSADDKWELKEVRVKDQDRQPKIDDAEALARHGGFVYLFGSHFGKKKGKLEATRQFVARFREAEVQGTSPEVDLKVRRDDFDLHGLLNDALVRRQVDLIPRGSKEESGYIEKTRTSDEPGKEKILATDRALNIEGATFLDSGQLALGLRYPVTKEGNPVILVLDDVDALFKEQMPKVVALWVLQKPDGTPARLRGIRALDSSGGEIQALVGSIERTNSDGLLLIDHPGADSVTSEHWAFSAPAILAPNAVVVPSRLIRDLKPALNVEGVFVDDCGGDWYVFDELDKVRLLHETARP